MSATDINLSPAEVRRFNGPPADKLESWFPFVRTFRGYQPGFVRRDFAAGLTTALFAVPQGMAYALIAGFSPTAGIATSVAASILGAAFGSSEFLINGPTNAISVMIAGNAALFAAQGDPVGAIILLTLVIGLLQICAGLMKLGSFVRFVSEPVLTGFTAGAGVYIVINQMPAFFGLQRSAIPTTLFGWTPPTCAIFDLGRMLRAVESMHLPTFLLAVGTFLAVRILQRLEKRLDRRIPATFFAVLLVTFIAWVLGLTSDGSPSRVRVIGDIEPLTRTLPSVSLPPLSVDPIRSLFRAAAAIALMGAVEAIAIGKTLASRAGHHFDASRQLIGEGLCNVGASFVGGFASSGSFSRTAVNHEAGAVTRMSCIASGVLVLVLVILFAPQMNLIPIAALAGTLIHIGTKLVDVARLRSVFETTTGDRAVLIATFGAVLFSEHLENALYLGVGISIFYALRRAEGFKLRVLDVAPDGSLHESSEARPSETGDITVLNLQGELFFAAAEELQHELKRMLDDNTRFLVLRVQEAYNIDSTTAEAIAHVAIEARHHGGRLILCGVRPGMYGTFERAGLLGTIGADALFPAEGEVLASTKKALAYAHQLAREADAA